MLNSNAAPLFSQGSSIGKYSIVMLPLFFFRGAALILMKGNIGPLFPPIKKGDRGPITPVWKITSDPYNFLLFSCPIINKLFQFAPSQTTD